MFHRDNRRNATMTTSIALSLPVLSAARNERFRLPDEENFANKLLSLRYQFGGHEEKTAVKNGGT
jgi:6-phosphogluconate dehydrogenase (decarboxylating)